MTGGGAKKQKRPSLFARTVYRLFTGLTRLLTFDGVEQQSRELTMTSRAGMVCIVVVPTVPRRLVAGSTLG